MSYLFVAKPNLSFADAAVDDVFYDLRNIVGFGVLKVTAKDATTVTALNLVTETVVKIPAIDFWAYQIA